MSALAEVAAAGGRVWAEGDKLRYRLPKGHAGLLDKLRAEKAQILAELQARDEELLARCKEACKGLSLWPAELAAALSDDDRAAVRTDDPAEIRALRCFAEGLAARLRTGTLPKSLHEAYARLRAELAANPGLKFACETLTPDADPVLLAVAVRGAGFATLRIAKDRYDAGQLLTLVDRLNPKEDS